MRRERRGRERRERPPRREEEEKPWIPRTMLGREVVSGKYKGIDEILERGRPIMEPEIVNALVPNLKEEIIYIGGSPGKGGGIRRTATKMTARMHRSGRRFSLSAIIIVGNGDGIVGVGKAGSREHRIAIEKAADQSKLSVIKVKRGCGSWECGCRGNHSIPFKVEGSYGSVKVTLIPAPKGVGIVADDESKKILRLAGIKDIWLKTSGNTGTRGNLAFAVFNTMKKLNEMKGEL